jgi:hypothetical protein
MATLPVELFDPATVGMLCESWREIAPTLTEVSRRTGLSRPEALLLYVGSMLADVQEGLDRDDPEPWKTA